MKTNRGGGTPLHLAAYHGHADIAAFLISYGAGISVRDNKGITPLFCAGLSGPSGCGEYCLFLTAHWCARPIMTVQLPFTWLLQEIWLNCSYPSGPM